MKPIFKKFKIIFLLNIIIILISGYLLKQIFLPYSIASRTFNLNITKNESLKNVALDLKTHNIITNQHYLLFLLRILGKDRKIFAGIYILKFPLSLWQIAKKIANTKPDQIIIIINDGMDFQQLKNYIDKLDYIKHLTQNLTQQQIAGALKINYSNLEGLFYPATYYIAWGESDLEIYNTAYKLMQKKLSAVWNNRESNTFYQNSYQLLTMASLITKETANIQDMYAIAAVFNNRLKIQMKLQDDPAVFFGLAHKNSITRDDFKIDTPYNTYIHYGLPPTPITFPNVNALNAAAHPLNNNKLLYFLAVGAGKTKFSNNYNAHTSAIKQLKKVKKYAQR